MLTANQREMLTERKEKGAELSNERKKYIDYTLRNYIKKQLDALSEIPEIIEVLPKSQTKLVITAERVIGIAKLLEEISWDTAPIEVDKEGKPYVVYVFSVIEELSDESRTVITKKMKYKFPAFPEEVKLADDLGEYKWILDSMSLNVAKRSFSVEEWNTVGANELRKIITRRGQEFKLEIKRSSSFIGKVVADGPGLAIEISEDSVLPEFLEKKGSIRLDPDEGD